jgi:hypothetical protein
VAVAKKIVILEDNKDRRAAMRACLVDRFYQFEALFFEDAAAMVHYLEAHLQEAIVICLDHDLEMRQGPDGRSTDPGTGRAVADFLARHAPGCPVVIHTSNATAAVGMEMALKDAHWQTDRVMPCGDLDWIPTQWFRSVRRAIVGPTKNKQQTLR